MFAFDNTFSRELDGAYVAWEPRAPSAPRLLWANDALAVALGVDPGVLRAEAPRWLSGAEVPPGAQPLAQAYAGHQFGGLSPQLGDGRALLLGEVADTAGRRVDVQLKGCGRTPFSRGGDGLAAVGPMLREVIIGEALHALGVPTSRALAVVATGDPVYRDTRLDGAVLTRVAASHLRVGTLEFFAIRELHDPLRRLVDHALARHHPGATGPTPAHALLAAVRDAQAALVARWMGVGFVHGVLNTDNVALSGEAIDFGPCAFMDAHDPATVFSSIDHAGRYAYGNQPAVTAWNLSRLAGALLPVMGDDPEAAVADAQALLDAWPATYRAAWHAELRRKLGLDDVAPEDAALFADLEALLAAERPDHTRAFRRLADAARGDGGPWLALFDTPEAAEPWLRRYLDRLGDRRTAAASAMDAVNPLYIPRNHLVEEALAAATSGDLGPFHALLEAVRAPFEAVAGREAYEAPAPEAFTACYQTFCGT